jgi:hypothetical protein
MNPRSSLESSKQQTAVMKRPSANIWEPESCPKEFFRPDFGYFSAKIFKIWHPFPLFGSSHSNDFDLTPTHTHPGHPHTHRHPQINKINLHPLHHQRGLDVCGSSLEPNLLAETAVGAQSAEHRAKSTAHRAMKIYIHFEGEACSFTSTQAVSDTTTPKDALASFVSASAAAGTHLQGTLSLKTVEGKDITSSKRKLVDLVEDMGDLFVSLNLSVVAPPTPTPTPTPTPPTPPVRVKGTTPASASASASKGKKLPPTSKTVTNTTKTATKTPPKSPKTPTPKQPHEVLQSLLKEKSYRQAREAAQQLLSLNPHNPHSSHTHDTDTNDTNNALYIHASATLCLAEVYSKTHRPKEAISVCRTALQNNPNNVKLLHLLGRSLAAAGSSKEAVVSFKAAISVMEDPVKSRGQGQGADKDHSLMLELVANQAEALFACDKHTEAVDLINRCVTQSYVLGRHT